MRLVVSGHEIGTTAEHPFHIEGIGWRCAAELRPGDRLSSHNGVCGVVEVVEDTGEVATVYNMRVAEYHTYFVGCDEWGFSVWAHNAKYTLGKELGGGWWEIIDDSGNVVKKVQGQQKAMREAADMTAAIVKPLPLDTAATVASKYGVGDCIRCAEDVVRTLGPDANTTFIKIRTRGNIGAEGFPGTVGQTGVHVGVDIDGVVAIDNLYRDGVKAGRDYLSKFIVTGEVKVSTKKASEFFEDGVFNSEQGVVALTSGRLDRES